MSLTFSEVNLTRSESEQGFNHKIDSWSVSDWMLAVTGELGEAANIAKKLKRIEEGIRGNINEDKEKLKEGFKDELADIAIYLDLLAQSQGVDLQSAMIDKFNKTSKKVNYPKMFALKNRLEVEEV